MNTSPWNKDQMVRLSGMLTIQLLLGHKKQESTVRYLGIEVDYALDNSKVVRAATATLCQKLMLITPPACAAL
ncbi:hypothetical protein [Providencia huaxiensis]|uniref:hypothetical protein n=1 Tax=Providencia huaxiensis TaxID=2027290 RepID=UPI001FD3DDE2|nr:hypothetical protein [Providencia huaxiensis]